MKIRPAHNRSHLLAKRMRWLMIVATGVASTIVVVWGYGLWSLLGTSQLQDSNHRAVTEATPSVPGKGSSSSSNNNNPFCVFRRYPPHRYYDLKDPLDFLVNDEYVYGEWPILIEPSLPKTKLCVDQTEWLPTTTSNNHQVWPFADGTNPSLLSLDRIRDRGAGDFANQVQERFGSTAAWIMTVCMTNSQCTWNDKDQSRTLFDLPDLEQKEPNTVRNILQVYTKDFSTLLGEQTIKLLRDAPWGRRHSKVDDSWQIPALDDARLFTYDSKVYVSFREGPGFGYHNQVLNPLHLGKAHVHIKASESSSMCCGRNMALIDGPTLQALTWVDPVTVESVDARPGQHAKQPRKTKKERQQEQKILKSHIHGTNGYMIPISETELLGVAHFHRPNDRKPNVHARFGHHYTHAFYLVSGQTLSALSPEFLLAGSEIIQFISGLEFDGTTVTLAYGINDCEGAVVSLDWKTVVQPLLRPVEPGQQVVNLMAKLKNPPSQ